MLIAYIDEFGHVGPYIDRNHPKYWQHPVFGYAGFIIPSSHAREIGAAFVKAKQSLFKTEIDKSELPSQWERKGSEYFTTGSIEARPEQIKVFSNLIRKLKALEGIIFYYGDEKPRGTLKETDRSSKKIAEDALRQTINRICRYAESKDQDVLIIADSFDDKSRQELASKMYAHIYSSSAPDVKRAVEAPLHVESKLNSGVQFADWICGIVGRACDYQFVNESEFGWVAKHFGQQFQGRSAITKDSKIHAHSRHDVHHSNLFR